MSDSLAQKFSRLLQSATLPFGTLLHAPAPGEIICNQTAPGGLKMYYFPPTNAKPEHSQPAVLWIHGGGWAAGSPESFFPMARYTAARGAASFVVQYRLVNSGGATMADSIADCKSAVRHLRGHAAKLKIDPHQIAVVGESAGGHLAAAIMLEGFNNPTDDLGISARPDALVLYNPCLDLGASPFTRLLPSPSVGSATSLQELADKYSPLAHVRPGLPPTICIHGESDTVVSPDQSRRFSAAMQRAGNRCDLILLPGIPHAFLIPAYKCSEAVVVNALRLGDQFLTSLGYFKGEPILTVSDPPAWVAKWPPAPVVAH